MNCIAKIFSILFFFFFLISCEGKITDEKLELYTRNEKGVKKLTEFIKNDKENLEMRLKAILALVKNGLEMKVKSIVYQCPDKDKIAIMVAEKLLPELNKGGDDLYRIRDTLFSILSILPEDKKANIQKSLAEWAFGSLKDDAPREKVKDEVERKILVSQIEELGAYGVRGATILIKNGFSIERMLSFIFSFKEVKYQLLALDALKILHKIPNIQITYFQLEKIGEINSVDALNYLLEIALDKTKDRDVRSIAFNEAIDLFELSEIKKNSQPVLSKLYKLLEFPSADDRWSAAHYILKLEGYEAIPKVIEAFKDDGIYLNATEDPMKSVVDFCKLALIPLKEKGDILKYLKAWIKSTNRVQITIGMVCLKILANPVTKTLLKPHLGLKKYKLDDILGEEMTIASLAQNVVEGIDMLNEVEKDLSAGKISKEFADIKKFAIEVELVKNGDEYKKEVEKRVEYEKKRKKK